METEAPVIIPLSCDLLLAHPLILERSPNFVYLRVLEGTVEEAWMCDTVSEAKAVEERLRGKPGVVHKHERRLE